MKVLDKPIGSIRRYPGNPRKNAQAVQTVADLIREFGWRQPIVVDAAGVIVIGDTRYQAAELLGLKKVPVHVAEGLSAEQIKALRLADNKSSELAEWDTDKLAQELEALAAVDFDLALTAFDEAELVELRTLEDPGTGKGTPPPGGDEEPAPPAVPAKPITGRGDLWLLGPHRLLCGDSTSRDDVARLMAGETADMVFTDPPYAIYGSSTGIASDITDDKMVRPFFRDIVARALEVSKAFAHLYICCDWRSWSSWWEVAKGTGLAPKNMIVWDKAGGLGSMYANCHELIFFGSFRPMRQNMSQKLSGERQVNGSNVWNIPRAGRDETGAVREHNAQKPVELAARAIRYSSDEGELVLDLFGGSGTTLIAAGREGRACCMMEIAEAYADVIVRRWQRETGEEAVLEGDGRTFDQIAEERDAA